MLSSDEITDTFGLVGVSDFTREEDIGEACQDEAMFGQDSEKGLPWELTHRYCDTEALCQSDQPFSL